MKKCIKYSIWVIVLLAFVALIWYHIPVKTQKTVMACTADGETAEVTFDLSYARHLLGETELNGTITVNGVMYESTGGTSLFVLPGSSFENLHDNIVIVSSLDNKFHAFYLYVKTGDDAKTYYGEAKDAEEAEKVIAQFYEE